MKNRAKFVKESLQEDIPFDENELSRLLNINPEQIEYFDTWEPEEWDGHTSMDIYNINIIPDLSSDAKAEIEEWKDNEVEVSLQIIGDEFMFVEDSQPIPTSLHSEEEKRSMLQFLDESLTKPISKLSEEVYQSVVRHVEEDIL